MPPGRDFDGEVYAVVAQIPPGRVATYGLIARLVGAPTLARRVGRALASAPAEVPCHRVVDASGRPAPGWSEQPRLLAKEGIVLRRNGRVDLRRALWEPLRDLGGQ